MKLSKEQLTKRNEKIWKLRGQGKTLQGIGDLFDITRERVRQLLDIGYNASRKRLSTTRRKVLDKAASRE